MRKVTIRPIERKDTDNIIRWRNSDGVRLKFIDQRLFTKESHEAWLSKFVDTKKVAQFIISVDGEDVGSIYLRDIDYDEKTAEYGVFIGEESARGKGVGYEATGLILDYAFNDLLLDKVFLRVYADNEHAIRSYERSGFVRNGQSEFVEVGDEKREVIFMSLEKKNFGKQ